MHAWGRQEVLIYFSSKSEIKGMALSRDLSSSGKTILKLISNRARFCVYSEFKQLRMDVEQVAYSCDHEN